MRSWSPERIAAHAGATLAESALNPEYGGSAHAQPAAGPSRAVIDSREAGPGDLFVGLTGERTDGGAFAQAALDAGAWGALVSPAFAHALNGGVVLSAPDPLACLQNLARAWRRELDARVIAITGSVGKTSTKDLTAAMLRPDRRVHASRANFNTEIGLPLELLAAPAGSEVLVLELAMRGAGQIAELAAICEPDVGVITNVGPVHLELLGSVEAIAAAKAELVRHLPPTGTAIVPAGEPLLEPHLPAGRVVRFGPGGDVQLTSSSMTPFGALLTIDGEHEVEVPFTAAHMQLNALAAFAAARAVGVTPSGRVEVELSALRGQRVLLPGGAVVVNDCYNANPLSMRAALDDLSRTPPDRRRVAILGDMLELGPTELDLHREIGAHALAGGVDVLVTVGPLATAMLEAFDGESYAVADAAEAAALACEIIEPGDTVLVKASRGVGLEVVAEALAGEAVA